MLYLFGEGASGLKRRARAIEIQQQSKFDNVIIPNRYVDITDADDRMMIDRLVKKHHPVLIIYDTLNSLATIDNNSSREVSGIIKDLRAIQDSVKASSIIVHHVGKDESKGMEGSHAFTSNSDFVFQLNRMSQKRYNQLRVSTPINMLSEMICVKQKEGESFSPRLIEMTTVDLGFKENYGECMQATSLAVLDATTQLGHEMPDDSKAKTVDDELLEYIGDANQDGSFVHRDQIRKMGFPDATIDRLIRAGIIIELANSNTFRVKDSPINEQVATKAYNDHVKESLTADNNGMPDYKDTAGDLLDYDEGDDSALKLTAKSTGASISEVKKAQSSAVSGDKPAW